VDKWCGRAIGLFVRVEYFQLVFGAENVFDVILELCVVFGDGRG